MVGTYCLKWKVWLSTNLYFKFVTRIWHHMERRSHWTEVSKIGITGINSNKLSLYTFSVSSLTRHCKHGWVLGSMESLARWGEESNQNGGWFASWLCPQFAHFPSALLSLMLLLTRRGKIGGKEWGQAQEVDSLRSWRRGAPAAAAPRSWWEKLN